MNITPRQRGAFFILLDKAMDMQALPREQWEAFRRGLILRACPRSGGLLRNVGSGAEFDRLMLETAIEAGDVEAAGRFGTAESRRLAALAEAQAEQIAQIAAPEAQAQAAPEAYLRGILKQAGWVWALPGQTMPQGQRGAWWLDLTAEHLRRLLCMLDTHRRRLLRRVPKARRRALAADGSERSAMPMGFDRKARYVWQGGELWRVPTASGAPAAENSPEDTPEAPASCETRAPVCCKPLAKRTAAV